MTVFMPDTATQPASTGVIALYRLFEDQPWRQVINPATKRPVIFEDSLQAIKAAKARLKVIMNPELRCETVAPEIEEDQDVLGLAEWRAKQQAEYADVRALVKNGKNRRKFTVEVKGRKKRAKA